MATDHCGPSLATLVNPERKDDKNCVWYNKKKGRKEPEQCGNNVSKDDISWRAKSIKRLRSLISYDSGVAKWNYSDVAAVQAKLEEVSKWMLCTKAHHRDYSSRIYEGWIKELGDPTPTETEGHRNHLALNDRPTEGQIRRTLGIENIEGLPCLSRTSRCRNVIASKSKIRAADIVKQLAGALSFTKDMELSLLDIAELLLCRNSHQAHAIAIQADWIRQLKKLFVPKETTIHPSSTPYRHRTAVKEIETPESILSSAGSSSSSIGTITPATSPSVDRIGRAYISGAASPLSSKHTKEAAAESSLASGINQKDLETPEGQRYLQHNKVTRRTIRERNLGYLPPVPPSFKEYRSMTIKKAMADLQDKLEADLTVSEIKDGYIYGYRRPSSGSHIKIGVSTDVDRRMEEWRRQCNYKPEVVFRLKVPHAMKVEHLIHICLHRERRCEEPGACNSGNGCGRRHIEWFEVALSRLRDVAEVWQRWIEMKPYDGKGILKQEWRTRFKSVALSGLADSWRQWIDFTPVKVELRDKVKLDIKVETVPGLGTEDKKDLACDKEIKSGVVITETEIKPEPDDDDNTVLREDLGAISRNFNQRLRTIQDTVEAEENTVNGASLIAIIA